MKGMQREKDSVPNRDGDPNSIVFFYLYLVPGGTIIKHNLRTQAG